MEVESEGEVIPESIEKEEQGVGEIDGQSHGEVNSNSSEDEEEKEQEREQAQGEGEIERNSEETVNPNFIEEKQKEKEEIVGDLERESSDETKVSPNFIEKRSFVENIVFVRQLKVGSTTLHLVLHNVAERHNLMFGSPKTKTKKSVNISAHHNPFPSILKDDIVKDPKRYFYFYREPTSKAASLFYWKHREKKARRTNPEWQNFSLEDSENMSSEHLDLLSLWTKQGEGRIEKDFNQFAKKYHYNADQMKVIKKMVSSRNQYKWIAKTPIEAIETIKAYNILVGKTEDMTGSLLLFRKVLGWSLLDILYVNTNYYPHLKFQDWPPEEQKIMNQTLVDNGEWYFHSELDKIWESQINELYGGKLIFENDKVDFQRVRTLLYERCLDLGGKDKRNQNCRANCALYREQYQCMVAQHDFCIANEIKNNGNNNMGTATRSGSGSGTENDAFCNDITQTLKKLRSP